MEISNKKMAFLLIASITLAFTGGFLMRLSQRPTKKSYGTVYVIYETSGGRHVSVGGNIHTNIAERHARNIFGFDNVTNWNATQWIALGNSTISASKTKLDTEATTLGFQRAGNDTCVTWLNGTDYAYNVTRKFTKSGGGTIRVNATSCHWSGVGNSDNNMYALATITAQTYEDNDNCTIVWVFTKDYT